MRLVLLGPPGAGKGTQAQRIAAAFELVNVSTGDIFRRNAREETPLGLEARQYMDRGDYVPDEVVIGMVCNRLAEDDAAGGFIVDGFPRTVPQAEALEQFLDQRGQPLDAALRFEVPEDELITRLEGRRVAEGRSDDASETISQRFNEYRTKTAPLVAFYSERDKLVDVDGVGEVEDVFQRVLKVLQAVEGGRA